ncbi:unnamed protein product [Vitrella brassicaformis CCMP3155]|uniref:Uncharacterized protein n=2 Tax=Vitrella brassicaformis TaxID=1169539 RepID=A0A0G4EK38_VITBC|nr:unnamed protein product [Vitrella brassicaformis CCMP3155]|eukprot:CEL97800.1 unnamed protein product [Vitrella brassicaformis CCMP3155]
MGKKKPIKAERPPRTDLPTSAVSPALQRLNYLYQAAHQIGTKSPALGRYYLATMKEVALKHVIRLEPAVKHSFCKTCCSLLVPGQTAHVTIEQTTKRRKRTGRGAAEGESPADEDGSGDECEGALVAVECVQCGRVKRYGCGKGRQTEGEAQAEGDLAGRDDRGKGQRALLIATRETD